MFKTILYIPTIKFNLYVRHSKRLIATEIRTIRAGEMVRWVKVTATQA